MNETERELLNALKQLAEAVQSIRTAETKPNLFPLFQKIDSLRDQLPKGTDSQLLHYLHKQSYEKARLWLEGRDAENAAGSCRH
jgi:DNA phosphorothioation-dependent restriction protein DptG